MYGICTYICHKFKPNVGEYSSPMDPMGYKDPFEPISIMEYHVRVFQRCSLHSLTACRIVPFSKYLVTPIYEPFRSFGKRITPIRGLTNHSYGLWFQTFLLVLPLPGEMIQLDYIIYFFKNGLKPPTSSPLTSPGMIFQVEPLAGTDFLGCRLSN